MLKRIPRGQAIERSEADLDAMTTSEALSQPSLLDEAVADASAAVPDLGERLRATDADV